MWGNPGRPSKDFLSVVKPAKARINTFLHDANQAKDAMRASTFSTLRTQIYFDMILQRTSAGCKQRSPLKTSLFWARKLQTPQLKSLNRA